MITQRTIGVWACSAWLWLAVSTSGFVTIAQGDRGRSARAPRTSDVSANGRYVAFESWTPLVPADDNRRLDIYVLDRVTGRVTLETDSLAVECSHPRISGDGRYVVFESRFTDASGQPRLQVVLRDRSSATTRILATRGNASPPDGWSRTPDISDDGRVVVFSSASTNLVDGPDANGALEDVYAMQLETGAVSRISVSTYGAQSPRGTSILPSISSDGRWVAFASTALLDGAVARLNEESATRQIYVRDLSEGTTIRVSRPSRGTALDGDSSLPAMSGDGKFIAFVSDATNLAGNDNNRSADIFLFDRVREETTLVSRAANGSAANGLSANPSISSDGRFIAFQSDAANMVCMSRCPQAREDINLLWDTFVFDRLTSTMTRVSEDELGGWMDWSAGISIDGSGSVVAFSSRHPRDASDRLDDIDLFVRTLKPPAMTSRTP